MKYFIGFHSLANCVTLAGLLFAITACFLSANGEIKLAIFLLFLACVCDTFDGRLARLKKRSDDEKFYGIQIDSLCDVISFGLTPCFMAFSFGFNGALDVIIYGIFIICGAIRLAYFNTLARKSDKPVKYFRGIPIPVSTFVLTALFVLTTFLNPNVSVWFFRIFMLLLAIGYVLNIKIPKPNLKTGMAFIAVEILLILVLVIAGDCVAPQDSKGNTETSQESSEVSETSDISTVSE